MNAAVRIDPETGLKVFNTRAAKASETITGKGSYSVLTDQKLKELPEMPPGAANLRSFLMFSNSLAKLCPRELRVRSMTASEERSPRFAETAERPVLVSPLSSHEDGLAFLEEGFAGFLGVLAAEGDANIGQFVAELLFHVAGLERFHHTAF